MKLIYQFLMAATLLVLCMACTTHYYVVRHAEKANSTSNTPLSQAGHDRAEDLAEFLLDKNIKNVFVSNYLRTQQTAQPTADAAGVTEEIYQVPSEQNQLIQQLKIFNDNRGILVVNHSNTVPIIVDSLMRSAQNIVIDESDFDNIYHIRVRRCLSVTRQLEQLTYGTPTN